MSYIDFLGEYSDDTSSTVVSRSQTAFHASFLFFYVGEFSADIKIKKTKEEA